MNTNLLYTHIIKVLFLIVLLSLCSCEDVITIDLEDSDPQIVVDAWINNLDTEQKIILTSSQDYFENSDPQPILGAQVSVTNSQGQTIDFLDNNGDGQYTWTPSAGLSIGNIGDTFQLNIDLGGYTLEAESKMNRVPQIDSIKQETVEGELLRDDGIYLEFIARDFQGIGDAYWIKSHKDGRFFNRGSEINIAFDAGFDAGSQTDGIIFIPPIRSFTNELSDEDLDIAWNPGEVSRVEIHSINHDAFNFLEITRDQINNGSNGIFALPLVNTRTNIKNSTGVENILGFFNVSAVSFLEKTVE